MNDLICGCSRGGDCTRMSVCAAESLLEEKDGRIAELEAERKLTEELHAAILALIGSEGMTDAKFVRWVEAALEEK